MRNFIILLIATLLFSSCQEEEKKPIVHKNSNRVTPLSCLKLDEFKEKNSLNTHLKTLYKFNPNCDYTLTLSYKKDIVCNSSYNIDMKSTGKFPKSFIKLKVRKGLDTLYSYYLDLYSNIEPDDIDKGFNRLKSDLLNLKSIE